MAKNIDKMSIEELKEASGGWPVGRDLYTFEDYLKAGIVWRHYWLGKDKYCDMKGRELSQGEAEFLVRRHEDGTREVSQSEYNEFIRWKNGTRQRPLQN